MLCAVKLRVLGFMAYWYTGSAFHQIPNHIFRYVTSTNLSTKFITTIHSGGYRGGGGCNGFSRNPL